MFSCDTLINLSNGTKKPIKDLTTNDFILNKLKHPIQIFKVTKHPLQTVVSIQLNNNTEPFYCTLDTTFLVTIDKTHKFETIQNILNNNNVQFKTNLQMFNCKHNLTLLSHSFIDNLTDVYSLETHDTEFTQGYYVNDVITFNTY